MHTGIVKWFKAEKGYGFITPDAPGGDIFVHIKEVKESRLAGLSEGDEVEYELKASERTGKMVACRIRIL